MPAKQPQRVAAGPPAITSSSSASGYVNAAYKELTAPENASVVRSVAIFGVAVAFLHSSLSEFLLPPI